MMELERLIEGAVNLHASDVHVMEGSPPYMRIDETVNRVDSPVVGPEEMAALVKRLMPERLARRLAERRGVDFAWQHGDLTRCRVIIYYQRHRLNAVFRLLPVKVPTIEQMELPQALKEFANLHRGLVLVTGPTGCGKSTTLATVVNEINAHRRVAIVTIEDPIEYVHENRKSIISQREIGDDIDTFTAGITQAMRQDPDVLLIGEMRDLETMGAAVRGADTGHLVLSTLHTSSAVQTVERIYGTFPETEQPMLVEQLAANIRVVMTQELVKRAGGSGRIAAMEIMVGTDTVAKLIRELRFADIYELMKGAHDGMMTLDRSLADLARAGKIKEEEGAKYTRDLHSYHRYVIGRRSSGDEGGVLA